MLSIAVPRGLAEDDIGGFAIAQNEVIEQRRFFDIVRGRRRRGQCKIQDMLKRGAVTRMALGGLRLNSEAGRIKVHCRCSCGEGDGPYDVGVVGAKLCGPGNLLFCSYF